MYRILTLLIALHVVSNSTFGQQKKKYSILASQAQTLYHEKDYRNAALSYSKLFYAFPALIQQIDRINASCSWTRINEPDSAFNQLFLLSKNEAFHNFNLLNLTLDLRQLQEDQRWNTLIDIIKKNRTKQFPGLNYSLVEILDTVYLKDQTFRWELNEIEKRHGWQSEEMKKLWKNIVQNDLQNQAIITEILDKHGWLGLDSIGIEGNATLFLVIQHADIKTQEKYLPMMRDAVPKGDASGSSLALLEDRIALRQGKKQIYGSQISRDDETGKYYIMPLEDPENVDMRRKKVGLGPIRDYVKEWNITWDPEEYKKNLKELEAKQKK